MSTLSAIEDILLVPGREASGLSTASVGVIFGDRWVAWGICPATGADLPDFPGGFRLEDCRAALHQSIVPVLRGQPVDRFRPLADRLAALKEMATISRPVPERDLPKIGEKVSRRDLFTGRFGAGSDRPLIETVTVERRLHPALRYGLSQALLEAVSAGQNLTAAEVLAREYRLPQPDAPVPLRMELQAALMPDSELWPRLAAVGLNLTGDPEAELGPGGERLLRLARQVRATLARSSDEEARPIIHLELGGGLGRLHDHNLGKILGSLYGLERATRPYPVWVTDPLILAERQAHIDQLATLKEYIRQRRMDVQLVARAWIRSPEDVRAFLAADAIHAFHLDVDRLGGVNETAETSLAARSEGKGVLLGGGDPHLLSHLSLALRPELAIADDMVGALALEHEMDRALAWIASRARDDRT